MRAVVVGLLVVASVAACRQGTATTPEAQSPWSTVFAKGTPSVPIEIQTIGYRYVPSDVRAQAGRVVFYLVNPASESYAHNMVVTDQAGKEVARSAVVPPDTTAIFTINYLAPGTYTFGSTLEGIGYSADGTQASHGMVGRLTVMANYKANSSTVRASVQPDGSIRVLMADSRFTPSDIQVKAGKALFYLVSPASEGLPHNMVISDADGRVIAMSASIDPGQSAVFTVGYLPAGTYAFSSTLGGPDDPTQHYQIDAGMVGTLTAT